LDAINLDLALFRVALFHPESNIEHLLARTAAETGRAVRFNAEAKTKYLQFAQSNDALWSGNFRDLSASITRLATLADGGRISTALVDAELQRFRWMWQRTTTPASRCPMVDLEAMMGTEKFAELDLFDRVQIEAVIGVCREARTLSDVGRKLFDRSRAKRSVVNDADRLRKYLQKFGLSWEAVSGT
jgi:transcriptional regulatory protein RtcR